MKLSVASEVFFGSMLTRSTAKFKDLPGVLAKYSKKNSALTTQQLLLQTCRNIISTFSQT